VHRCVEGDLDALNDGYAFRSHACHRSSWRGPGQRASAKRA
jgi:hypothetical protein